MDSTYVKPFSAWNLPKVPCSNPGDIEEIEYVAEMTDEGYKLKETGNKINVKAKVQAFKDDSNLIHIINTLLDNGLDVSNGVEFLDEAVDLSVPYHSTEILNASRDYEKNIAYYEAKLKEEKEKQAQAQAQAQSEGGNQ